MSLLSLQVLSEDVRTTAAFISSLGKIPVVTPSSPITHSITLRHWVLAAKMLACSGMSAKQVDSCLVSAGFTKGPFATMKEVCLREIAGFCSTISRTRGHQEARDVE